MSRDPFEEYISPQDAVDQLFSACSQLEPLAPEHVEEIRALAQRFVRHLNGLDDVIYALQDVIRGLQS